jgi:hypothetical protein
MEDRLMAEEDLLIGKVLVEPARGWSPGFRWNSLVAVIIADQWTGN